MVFLYFSFFLESVVAAGVSEIFRLLKCVLVEGVSVFFFLLESVVADGVSEIFSSFTGFPPAWGYSLLSDDAGDTVVVRKVMGESVHCHFRLVGRWAMVSLVNDT